MAQQTFHFEDSGFVFDLVLTNTSLVAKAKWDFSFPGFGSKVKGIFELDPATQTITSLEIFNGKGDLLQRYSSFSDPKPIASLLTEIQTAFSGGGDIFPPLYAFWNSFLDGDFRLVMKGKNSVADVGTDGLAKVIGSKFGDTVHVFQEKDINFDGKKGSDTLAFLPQNGDEPASGGAVIDLSSTTNANPFGGTLTLKSVENLFGTIFNDDFRGNDAANRLDGGWDGVDSLRGFGGNDTLIFLPSDHIGVADGGTGTDLLWVDASRSLATSHLLDLSDPSNNTGVFAGATVANIEKFRFDEFTGAVKFEFRGSSAAETVTGGFGSDTLIGNGGRDTLIGGRGRDFLTGGADGDHFVFTNRLDSPSSGAYDIITDFSHAENDEIDLHKIDANILKGGNQEFSFIGGKDFHGKAGELRIFVDSGNAYVLGDTNGDALFDFWVQLTGVTKLVSGDLDL